MLFRILYALLLVHLAGTVSIAAGTFKLHRLTYDEVSRIYRLYIPEAYDGTEAWPLVVNMHGAGTTSFDQAQWSQMNDVADDGHFLVVYPEATRSPIVENRPFWNDINSADGVDDIGFIRRLIDELQEGHNIDSSRVYATGLSQGGAMSYLLANQLPDTIAAIASISGPQPDNVTAFRPFPIMLLHGTADSIVSIEGGKINSPLLDTVVPAIADVIDAWVGSNNCPDAATVTQVEDVDPDDESTVATLSFFPCDTYNTSAGKAIPSEVLYYKIENGGHTWPGAPIEGIGATNRDINASEEAWNFFSRHILPQYVPGDFNYDGELNIDDIDMLLSEIRSQQPRRIFDANSDDAVNGVDISYWTETLKHTWLGDANLDGEFNSGDLVAVFATGEYEDDTPLNSAWGEGDWDGDGDFLSGDLVVAFTDGGYEQGPRVLNEVPEPNGIGMLPVVLALAAVSSTRRSGRRF